MQLKDPKVKQRSTKNFELMGDRSAIARKKKKITRENATKTWHVAAGAAYHATRVGCHTYVRIARTNFVRADGNHM